MIFGGVKYLDNVNEDALNCTDVTIEIENCNTTTVEEMSNFGDLLFLLYRVTLGQDYDKEVG